ncbi:hypothetical protein CWI75_12295 [Kineobactrum sediminis]|uniref:Primase C-terminal 1 domain-containing protein n=1 Tax=Kineobactrum sediminis TaxID=1905677 RepID=A0A2N5Y2A3_9GAMM|nr:DUF5906 domain-containing protein [Kineobactrum sediminis]PLW82523.1 hypothetical protein CWI75_12295 [Kineobactrum sediminis]
MSDAARFIDHLASNPGDTHTFQVIPLKAGQPRILHGTLSKVQDQLGQLNAAGMGIFACVNETDGKGRSAANITRVRSLFLDLDGPPLEPVLSAGLQPHMIVESSRGKWHAYYLVSDCNLDEFTTLQRRLAARFNGDPSVNDLPRIMRVPGYYHRKLDKVTGKLSEPFLTRIERLSHHPAYTVETITRGLELYEEPPEAASAASLPPFKPEQVYHDGQRTSALASYAGRLISQGCSDDEAVAILTDWNKTCCSPPLPTKKVQMTYASIKKTDARKRAEARVVPKEIAALNRDHAVVTVGGKTLVLRERERGVDFMGPSDFRNFYNNHQFEGKPLGSCWMSHPTRRSYSDITFDPSTTAANDDVYNLWRGLDVEPRSGDCSLFLEHLRVNICSGNDACYDYLLNWMAHLVQFPGKLPGVAVVMKGRQGTGKGVVALNFGRIFGNHFRHVTSREHLLGRFNGHLQNAVLVFADEVIWGGNKEQEGTLKTLITEPRRQYEQKYQGVIELGNYTRVIMATNSDWAVPAGLEERRFFVLQVADTHIQDHTYFATLQQQMDTGGREALLHELLSRDLSGVEIRQFPRTAALAEQKELSLSSVERWWLDVLDEGGIGPCDSSGNLESAAAFSAHRQNAWPAFAGSGRLHDYYLNNARKLGERYPCTLAIFGKKIKSFVNLSPTRPTVDGRRVKGYLMPTLSAARRQFEQALGQPHDWGEQDNDA